MVWIKHSITRAVLLHILLYNWFSGLFPKQPVIAPQECYRFQKEFESDEDLGNISADLDLIRLQSLIIAERILGSQHKDTIFRWGTRTNNF